MPAPTAYSPNRLEHAMPRAVSQIIGKEKRITNIDRIMAYEKKKVAPSHYKVDGAYNDKVFGVYLGQNKTQK